MVDFSPGRGSEQRGWRPALVILAQILTIDRSRLRRRLGAVDPVPSLLREGRVAAELERSDATSERIMDAATGVTEEAAA